MSIAQYRRHMERRGYNFTKTNGGHWRCDHPDMDGPVFMASSPSDHRWMRNMETLVRRKMRGYPI